MIEHSDGSARLLGALLRLGRELRTARRPGGLAPAKLMALGCLRSDAGMTGAALAAEREPVDLRLEHAALGGAREISLDGASAMILL